MGLKKKFYVVPTRISADNQHEVIVFKRDNILFLPSCEESSEPTILESFKSFFESVLHRPRFSIRKGCVLPGESNVTFYLGSFQNKFLAVISRNPENVKTVEYYQSDFELKNGTKIEPITKLILKYYFARKRY